VNYFDTSALIKRFVEEPGSKRVDTILAGEPILATSKIAYAEIHAGLARKVREKALTAVGYRRTSRTFDNDWRAYVRVDLADPLLLIVRDLVRRHPLRGFDAIQEQLGEEIRLVASDERLLRAAGAEGLRILDVRR
jgi:predicted nucleic acid-binding protein